MPAEASQHAASTRDRLIRAAVQLIPELGWGSVTTRKVAARAGVRPGVVHYHFASVSDLLVEAAVQFSHDALAEPMAALASAPDVASGVDRLLTSVDSIASNDPAALMLSECFLAATREERLREQLRDLITVFRSDVAVWLRRHGHHADADATAAVLAAMLDGLFLHRAVDPALRMEPLRAPLHRLIKQTAPVQLEELP
jgi:AcrR family transcriptional regulator